MLFDDYDSIPACHLLRVLLAPPPNNCHSASEMGAKARGVIFIIVVILVIIPVIMDIVIINIL